MIKRFIMAMLACIAIAPTVGAQRTNPAFLAAPGQTAETVFDNGGAPWNFLTQINAENYDNGGQNVAFNQPNIGPPNCPAVPAAGQAYRPADFVNLYASTDGVQFQVGCNRVGAYYKYQINIPAGSAGPYVLNLRVANANPNAAQTTWTASIDAVSVGSAAGVVTANLNTFAVLTIGGTAGFNATVGNHVLTLQASGNQANLLAGEISSFMAAPVGGVAIPPEAQQAGFNTLAVDYTFSQPLYANNANWLDCAVPNNNPNLPWHQGTPGITSIACNIAQAVDPVTGDKVMHLQYLPSYWCSNIPQCGQMGMQTTMQGTQATLAYPNSYFEGEYRGGPGYSGNANAGGPMGYWSWSSTAHEMDFGELFQDQNGFANSCGSNHSNGDAWAGTCWNTFSSPNNNFIPPGYIMSNYHIYGWLVTSDGSTSYITCMYIDHALQYCNDQGGNILANQYADKHWLITDVESKQAYPPTQNLDLYIRHYRVFSCTTWNNPGLQCTGTTKVTGTASNGAAIAYWK